MLELIEYTHMLRVTKTFVKRNVEVLTALVPRRIPVVRISPPARLLVGLSVLRDLDLTFIFQSGYMTLNKLSSLTLHWLVLAVTILPIRKMLQFVAEE